MGTTTHWYLPFLKLSVVCISAADSERLIQQTGPCCQLKSSSRSFQKYSVTTYSFPGLGVKELTLAGIVHGRMFHKAFCPIPGILQTHKKWWLFAYIISSTPQSTRWPSVVSYLEAKKLKLSKQLKGVRGRASFVSLDAPSSFNIADLQNNCACSFNVYKLRRTCIKWKASYDQCQISTDECVRSRNNFLQQDME